MKKILASILICISALCMMSCGGQPEVAGKWNIQSVNGETITLIGEKTPFIEFNAGEGRVSGNSGCNFFHGFYKSEGNQISFSQVATTMMAGPEENMDVERKILDAFEKAASVKGNDQKLSIKDAEGKLLLELSK